MAGIAISYRREDSGWIAGRIFDRLKQHYGKSDGRKIADKSVIFMDYDSTPLGVDFRTHIKRVIDDCDVLLAIIGPQWLGRDEHGEPRIGKKGDWVRTEIEAALKRNIPVIPVLIDQTPMPDENILPEGIRDLAYRQAATINTQIDFNTHIDRLIREIDHLLGVKPEVAVAPQGAKLAVFDRWVRPSYALAAISSLALTAVVALYYWSSIKINAPAYTSYRSAELGVTAVFPNNILTLDNTEKNQRKLIFRDGDGLPLVTILRTSLPAHRDPKIGRANEISDLTRMHFSVTYAAPEREENWTNWYVVSGVNHGTEFYFRRWYSEDSVISIEFMYSKQLAPLFDKLIPKMTQELYFTSIVPKIKTD